MRGGFKLLIGLILFSCLVSAPVAAASIGETCDGIAAIKCDDGLWCEHPEGQRKVADAAGSCIKAPEVCTQDDQPVCGCDGETYGNDCMRKAAKVQLDYGGECKKIAAHEGVS
jgi:hypothetical protein